MDYRIFTARKARNPFNNPLCFSHVSGDLLKILRFKMLKVIIAKFYLVKQYIHQSFM